MCKDCGHSESLKDREIAECPMCQSTKIELIPYSKARGSQLSSGWSSRELVAGILGIIGFLLLLFGLPLMLGAFGSMVGATIPLGVTFAVVGLHILVIVIGVVTKGECLACLTGC